MITVHTSIYQYMSSHTSGAWHEVLSKLPPERSHGPYAECCELSRNSTCPFHLSCPGGFSKGDRGDQQPSGAALESLPRGFGTGERPCTGSATPQYRHWEFGISNMRQAMQTRAGLGVIDCGVDEFDLVYTRISMYVQVYTGAYQD